MGVVDKVTAAVTGKTEEEVKIEKEAKAAEAAEAKAKADQEAKDAAELKELQEEEAAELKAKQDAAKKESEEAAAAEAEAKAAREAADKEAEKNAGKTVKVKGLRITSKGPKGFHAGGFSFSQVGTRYITKAHVVARWHRSLAEDATKKDAADLYNAKWADLVTGGEKGHLVIKDVKEIPYDQVCKDGDVLTK